jgi:hypothetical protein
MGIKKDGWPKVPLNMILTDDIFTTIVNARRRRNIYDNFKKAVTSALLQPGRGIAIFVAILTRLLPVPLIATQILGSTLNRCLRRLPSALIRATMTS